MHNLKLENGLKEINTICSSPSFPMLLYKLQKSQTKNARWTDIADKKMDLHTLCIMNKYQTYNVSDIYVLNVSGEIGEQLQQSLFSEQSLITAFWYAGILVIITTCY